MKTISLLVVLAIVAVVPLGCGKETKDVIEYGTGQTAIEAKSSMQRKIIEVAIKQSIQTFEVDKERSPNSLQELVDSGCLAPAHTKDEYGRPLQSSVTDGKLVVRSLKADGTLNWEKTF